MIVPAYWAEAKKTVTVGSKAITLRRFGWSDTSEADAAQMAESRLEEAARAVMAGETVRRREKKAAYNGADGVPIREEILSRHGDAVITRNAYGAHCLNTPDVLFADVDMSESLSLKTLAMAFMALALLAMPASLLVEVPGGWVTGLVVAVLASLVFTQAMHLRQRQPGAQLQRMKARLQAFLDQHPGWNIRLYQTPNGWRLLATHTKLSPTGEDASEFFAWVGADPVYVRMCRNQQCFRARLTAKPWRIGINAGMKPRPGIWPIAADKMAARQQWVSKYEAAARQFRACHFVESLGSGAVHPHIRQLVSLHDEHCRATETGLAMA